MCTVVPNTITEKHNGKGEGSVVFKKLLYLCIGVAREGLNLNRGVASACVHAGFLSLKLAWKSWSLCWVYLWHFSRSGTELLHVHVA